MPTADADRRSPPALRERAVGKAWRYFSSIELADESFLFAARGIWPKRRPAGGQSVVGRSTTPDSPEQPGESQ